MSRFIIKMGSFGAGAGAGFGRSVGKAAFLLPGAFLFLLGVFALVAPKLLAALIAFFLFYLGAMALFIGWKLLQLKRKFHGFVKDASSRFVFNEVVDSETLKNFREDDSDASDEDQRKIIFH